MFFFFLCVFLFLSCDKSTDTSAYRAASPTVDVEKSDKEIERIAENARQASTVFFRNLARPEAGANNFFVKYPLTIDDNTEQVWLGNIRFKDGLYYGVLANTTVSLPDDKKKGRTVVFDPDAITDWMYVQDRKIIGGRSIKYLLEKIPEADRSEDQRKILQMFD